MYFHCTLNLRHNIKQYFGENPPSRELVIIPWNLVFLCKAKKATECWNRVQSFFLLTGSKLLSTVILWVSNSFLCLYSIKLLARIPEQLLMKGIYSTHWHITCNLYWYFLRFYSCKFTILLCRTHQTVRLMNFIRLSAWILESCLSCLNTIKTEIKKIINS